MRASVEWQPGEDSPPRWVRIVVAVAIVAVCVAALLLLATATIVLLYAIRN